MDSIFVLNKTNFEFFKNGKLDGPYWQVHNRMCYHVGEGEPIYIMDGIDIVDGSMKHKYDDYYHVNKFYSISKYKIAELVDISSRLHLPHGTKVEMHKNISDYIKLNQPVIDK